MIAISPQTAEQSVLEIEERKLPFEILSDQGSEVAARYGLRHDLPEDLREIYGAFGIDLPTLNGEPSWRLALPANYVIDREGVIRYAQVDPDYTVRPEPEVALAALEALD